MNSINFNHQQKKRKTWLFPLIVIVLLYISIPFLLINSGTNAIETAFEKTKAKSVELPAKQYSTGIVLIEFAEMFPGFTNWSKQIKEQSNKKMLHIYHQKCNDKSIKLFNQLSDYEQNFDSLSFQYEYIGKQMYMKAVVFEGQNRENIKILIPEKQKNELQDNFCAVWNKFFNQVKISTVNNLICQ